MGVWKLESVITDYRGNSRTPRKHSLSAGQRPRVTIVSEGGGVMERCQAEIVLSVKNLKHERSKPNEADNISKLSSQKCEHKSKLCINESQGGETKMSIMDWAGPGTKSKLSGQEIQLSAKGLSPKDPTILFLDLPRHRSRPTSMSSVSWGDIGYESTTSELISSEPVVLCEAQTPGPWTSLIQSMGKSKKEKQLRRTAQQISIQVEPPEPNEHRDKNDLRTLSKDGKQVCIRSNKKA